MTLGVLRVCQRMLPGSTRSGEKHRKKSSPTRSPLSSRMGRTTSRVVPGKVVLSRITSWPGRRVAFTACAADTT